MHRNKLIPCPFTLCALILAALTWAQVAGGAELATQPELTSPDDADLLPTSDESETGAAKYKKLTLSGLRTWLDLTFLKAADALDGEVITDDTIDDDSIDFADITLADFTNDAGFTTLTDEASLYAALSDVTAFIESDDTLDGENLGDDTVDDDSLDLLDITLADFTNDTGFTALTNEASLYAALSDVTDFIQPGDTIDGENIGLGTIDDDSLDFLDITLSDFTDDVGFQSALTNEAGLYAALSDVTDFIQPGDALDGEAITDDTIDQDAIDFASITLADFTNDANYIATGDTASLAALDITGTGALKLPVGTTAQRPGAPAEGDLRINSTDGTTEVYRGGGWRDLEATGGGGAGNLTTKGDLEVYTTSQTRLAVGTDGQVLTADSASAAGVKWAGLDGELITDDTIDQDSIDFTSITLADFTNDAGFTSLTNEASLYAALSDVSDFIQPGDTIDGENLGLDTVDDDSLDFLDITLADFTNDAGFTALTNEASLYAALSDVSDFIQPGDTIDGENIGDDTIDDDAIDLVDITLADFTNDANFKALTDEASLYTALSDVTEFIETGDTASLAALDITGTGALKLPVGTTAQRPGAPTEGDLRVNTTDSTTEIYRGGSWRDLEATGGGGGNLTTKGDLEVYTTSQTRLGVGTDGQVLTADSASAAGVKWATPAGGGSGAVAYVETQTASTSASLVFDNLGASEVYTFVFEDILGDTDVQHFCMEFSTDNGSTWITSGYMYAINGRQSGGIADAHNATALNVQITPLTMGTAAGEEGLVGELKLYKPASTKKTRCTFEVSYFDNSGGRLVSGFGSGTYNTGAAVDAVRFKMGGGNIASGEIHLFKKDAS